MAKVHSKKVSHQLTYVLHRWRRYVIFYQWLHQSKLWKIKNKEWNLISNYRKIEWAIIFKSLWSYSQRYKQHNVQDTKHRRSHNGHKNVIISHLSIWWWVRTSKTIKINLKWKINQAQIYIKRIQKLSLKSYTTI